MSWCNFFIVRNENNAGHKISKTKEAKKKTSKTAHNINSILMPINNEIIRSF